MRGTACRAVPPARRRAESDGPDHASRRGSHARPWTGARLQRGDVFWRPAARIRSPLARTASSKASCDSPASATSGSGMRCSSATSSLARRSSEFPVSRRWRGGFIGNVALRSPWIQRYSVRRIRGTYLFGRGTQLVGDIGAQIARPRKVWSSETGSSGVFHASPTTAFSNRGRVRLRNSRRAGQVPARAGSRPHRRTGCPVRVPR